MAPLIFGEKMAMSKRSKVFWALAILAIIIVVAIYLDLSIYGTARLSPAEVWNALFDGGTGGVHTIVNQSLKRVIIGLFVGAALAVCGAVMQAVFRNPLASPYLLGLSSGASLGAAIAILFSVPFIPLGLTQPLLAFVFCLMTMFIVYTISKIGGDVRTETLILAGVAISSLFSAVVSFLTYVAPSDKMGDIVFWTMGSLSRIEWDEMAFVIPIIVAGILLMMTQMKNLNAMMLGDAHAMDLGVDVRRVRLFLLIVSSLVVAAAVAFVGAIGFVGLVIPHIFRLLLGPDNRYILPISAIGGGAFILLCDFLSRSFASYAGVLPIGVVTSIIGAPFFVYLLCRKKTEVGW